MTLKNIKPHPKVKKFNEVYDKLSKYDRNELAILNDSSNHCYTWNMVKAEVDANTMLSHELLMILTRSRLI